MDTDSIEEEDVLERIAKALERIALHLETQQSWMYTYPNYQPTQIPPSNPGIGYPPYITWEWTV